MISPFELKTTRCLAVLIALIAGMAFFSETAFAQDATKGLSAKERYEQAVKKGRELAKELRTISVRFFDSSLAESYEWKAKWPEAAKELSEHKLVLQQATIDWFLECEKPDLELVDIVSAVSNEVYIAGDMELAWTLLQKIRQFLPEKDNIMLLRRMALVAIKTNRFDGAIEFLRNPDSKASIEELEFQIDKNLLMLCPLFIGKWEEEKAIRDKELEADDLPRVKLDTSNGEVIVELFENEAPETVANFISLVESGFYNDSVFHLVVDGVVAQTGIYSRVRKDPLKYVIKNESREPSVRSHFVGSLSMVGNKGGQGQASSVFAITMVPTPDLDWDGTEEDEVSQTVFGRVVSGMQNVMAMEATLEIDEETEEKKHIRDAKPSFINKATVLRKRNHEYTFEKIRIEDE